MGLRRRPRENKNASHVRGVLIYVPRANLSLGLLDTISEAVQWDEQMSEGKALSDREEAVLQALELMTRNAEEVVWLKASQVREQVARLVGQPVDQLGHAQWIAHIMTRLQLLDTSSRKRQMDGMMYCIRRDVVLDMMRRYEIAAVS